MQVLFFDASYGTAVLLSECRRNGKRTVGDFKAVARIVVRCKIRLIRLDVGCRGERPILPLSGIAAQITVVGVERRLRMAAIVIHVHPVFELVVAAFESLGVPSCTVGHFPTPILSLFGKGDLAKAKKDLTARDEQIAKLKEQIKTLQADRAAIVQQHRQELATLKNSYQAEIDKAIKETELLRKAVQSKDARIEQQSRRIAELDRKANPQRYRLSSGAELEHFNIPNLGALMPSIHIWTNVPGEKYDVREYIDTINPVWQEYLKGTATVYELINDIFEPQEQVNEAQAELLGAALILATGSPAQTRIGTGAGGSHSDLPWDGKKNTGKRR